MWKVSDLVALLEASERRLERAAYALGIHPSDGRDDLDGVWEIYEKDRMRSRPRLILEFAFQAISIV